MKTLELDLKKKVLIVDTINFILTEEMIYNKIDSIILADYEFICKGSELTEEISSKFIQSFGRGNLKRFKGYFKKQFENTAKEAIISAVESKGFYWLENPAKYERNGYEIYADKNKLSRYISKEEIASFKAEEKTFKNPLIFVKK